MKRKATDELIADRPPPMPAEMLSAAATPASTTMTATMTATTQPVDIDYGCHDSHDSHNTPSETPSETPVTTAHSPASASGSAPSAPSVSAVTATTAASRRFPSDLKTIRCTWPDCDKTFNRPARLTAHMRSHTNDRPFKCPDCAKTYLEEKHLRQHIKGSHTQERRYVCAECSKAFLTATRLRRHAAVHEGQDRFRCKGYDAACTRTFRKHQTLQRHIRVDHLEQPAFACSQKACGALFESAGALRRHVEREHAAPKFWCEECARATGLASKSKSDVVAVAVGFATRSLLESHMRHAHANCPFCDARCAGPAELAKHVDMHHSGKTVADRKTTQCPHAGCSKTFTRRANLNVHIRAAHEGLRFVCGTSGEDDEDDEEDDKKEGHPDIAEWHLRNEGCGRGFVSKMKLEEHILYVHLGHERPAPLKAEPAVLGAVAAADCSLDMLDSTRDMAAEADIIDALLGTNRTLACAVPGCTARFVRHHDLNQHVQREHVDGSGSGRGHDVGEPVDVGSEFNPDEFWIGGGNINDMDGTNDAMLPGGDDMFGAFIDMNAGMLSTASLDGPLAGPLLNTDDVQWHMDEAEMRRLIGHEGGAGAQAGAAADRTSFLDPDLFL